MLTIGESFCSSVDIVVVFVLLVAGVGDDDDALVLMLLLQLITLMTVRVVLIPCDPAALLPAAKVVSGVLSLQITLLPVKLGLFVVVPVVVVGAVVVSEVAVTSSSSDKSTVSKVARGAVTTSNCLSKRGRCSLPADWTLLFLSLLPFPAGVPLMPRRPPPLLLTEEVAVVVVVVVAFFIVAVVPLSRMLEPLPVCLILASDTDDEEEEDAAASDFRIPAFVVEDGSPTSSLS